MDEETQRAINRLVLLIGKTPMPFLDDDLGVRLYAKLEGSNLTGSVKDRPAFYMLKTYLEQGVLKKGSLVVESSSGNMALSLTILSHCLGLKFIAVVDANTPPTTLHILRQFAYKVEVATEKDDTGAYLKTRLKIVDDYQKKYKAFWTNQYDNQLNIECHHRGLGEEIRNDFPDLNYLFIGLGTCGTAAGVSTNLKKSMPNVHIIGVDLEGSGISGLKKTRHLPGLGSSVVPGNYKHALLDELIFPSERESIDACYELTRKYGFFVGWSSGLIYLAVKDYFKDKTFQEKPNVLFLCPDRGFLYLEQTYDPEWVKKTYS